MHVFFMKRIELKMAPKAESELKVIVNKGMRAVRGVTEVRISLLAHSGKAPSFSEIEINTLYSVKSGDDIREFLEKA